MTGVVCDGNATGAHAVDREYRVISALAGRDTRVDHFEQPVFAWR